MKKLFALLLAVISFGAVLGLCACDKPEPKDPAFTYETFVGSDGTTQATITGLSEYGEQIQDVTVPEKIDGYLVIQIADFAFAENERLSSIKFAKNSAVKYIGEAAFRNCKSLSTVILPNSLTRLGDEAFLSCSYLSSITLSNSLTFIPSYAFTDCKKLEQINIPASTTLIEAFAFNGCTMLETVTFDQNSALDSIEERAFAACHRLKNIVLPSALKSIDSYAFMDCALLESINIPASTTLIEAFAFNGCDMLRSATFDDKKDWSASPVNAEDSSLSISEEILESPSSAAEYLTFLYENRTWTKAYNEADKAYNEAN